MVDDRAVPVVEDDFDHLVVDGRRHVDLDWIPPGARPSDEVREEAALSPLGESFVDDGLLIDSKSGIGRIENDVDTIDDEWCRSLDEKLFVGLDCGGCVFGGVPGNVDPCDRDIARDPLRMQDFVVHVCAGDDQHDDHRYGDRNGYEYAAQENPRQSKCP